MSPMITTPHTKKYLISLTVLTLAALLVIPAGADAKKTEVSGHAHMKASSSTSCIKAFGHLIAPGWIRKHGTTTISEACKLPHGIAKKLGHGTNPENPDITAPVISAIAVAATETTASISWMTNEKADSTVFYGTTTPLDTDDEDVRTETDSSLVKTHTLILSDLEADTTYYAVIQSRDREGNVKISNEFSFTTDEEADSNAPIISNIVSVVGSSTLTVNWKTNELATSKLYYGTSTPLDLDDDDTEFIASSSPLRLTHSLMVDDLATSTTYYLVIESEDTEGNTRVSDEFSLTTGM